MYKQNIKRLKHLSMNCDIDLLIVFVNNGAITTLVKQMKNILKKFILTFSI
mgnify:FL=1